MAAEDRPAGHNQPPADDPTQGAKTASQGPLKHAFGAPRAGGQPSFIARIWMSLTTRLMILFLLLGVSGIALFFLIFKVISQSQSPPQSYAVPFLSYLSRDFPADLDRQVIQQMMDDTIYTLRIEGQQFTWATDETIPRLTALSHEQQVTDKADYYRQRGGSRYLVINRGDVQYIFGHHQRQEHDNMYQIVLITIVLTTLLVLLICYFIVFKLFRPISWIRRGAVRMGKGDLAYRIPYQGNDELGDLVRVVNQMAEDLEQIFDSKRQLLLAISHELRSPLTRMKLNTAIMGQSAIGDRLNNDIDEMRDIVEGLLDSERLQGRHTALDKKIQPLQWLLNDVVEEFAKEGGVFYTTAFTDEVEASFDNARIRFLLRNLIKNAVKYTDPSKRRIEVSFNRADGFALIAVKDNGIGIADQHISHIFSAFYRADQSRGRRTGGVGLGLYLCDLIVNAHGGTLTVASKLGEGSQFDIRLPL